MSSTRSSTATRSTPSSLQSTPSTEMLAAIEQAVLQAVQRALPPAVQTAMQPFLEKLEGLTSRLDGLASEVAAKDSAIRILEERCTQLEIDHDALEQYGRRMNVRVENVPVSDGESPASLQSQVINILKEAGAVIDTSDVVRLHRSTAARARENVCDGKKTSQVIVKLNNWRARESVHFARNAARVNGHPVKQDLTQRRRELITEANVAIRAWGQLSTPVYAYCNINCEPTMRRGREVERFQTMDDMKLALDVFRPR